MLKPYLADLHVHTVLSACAEVEMIPPLIVRRAQAVGLAVIAVTDHNICDNAEAVMRAAQGSGVSVLPGMELQTREEVHLLCLFDQVEPARRWQNEVLGALPPLSNREEFFGAQFVVDTEGEYVRTEERLLATSTNIGLEEAVAEVHALGGLAIPAHVDRPSFSVLANLGFVPRGLAADALEVTARFAPSQGLRQWPELADWPLIVGGDAHRLQEMCNRTLLKLESPTVAELQMAFRGEGGRKVVVDWPES